MYRVDYMDYALDEPDVPPVQPPKQSYTGILVFCGILLLAALFIMRQPISHAAEKQLAKTKQHLNEIQSRAEMAALKRKVTAKLTLVTSRMDDFEHEMDQIASQFRSLTETPLDQANIPVSRKVTYLMYQSDTFLGAWTHMFNNHLQLIESLAEKKQLLSRIKSDLSREHIGSDHLNLLDDVLNWIKRQQHILQQQRDYLDRIRTAYI